ncbi:hypothetical protein RCO28_36450 [Streptomyces sp. LHD-70]|uniref:hypothetical protein n=1 Tax=Streptomyces sp. LHD-70 TaxID=3072140 RepID=UPI00280DD893|nr:hypothetical protein [Streptomyces sp. LHD-70]MDQ8707918.1 hypothetical protein [Streptomyces sp. LHD-70]
MAGLLGNHATLNTEHHIDDAHPGHIASLIKQEIAAAAAPPRTAASTPSCS